MTRVGVALLLGAGGLMADGTGPFSGTALVPTVDNWMYPHAGSPGTRTTASTFTALPFDGGVDDRFAQFLLKFDTVAAGIPAGLGAANYDPSKVVLTCVMSVSDNVRYDPTEDARSTYGPTATADPDLGRPIEVHGAGFRNGFTGDTYNETSAFGPSNSFGAPGTRNAYALGYSPEGVARDVSHNVTQGFDSMPWGIGKAYVQLVPEEDYTELTPGDVIPVYAHIVFQLDLSLPGVADYVRNSLNAGSIWLTVSSLHSASQMGTSGYPVFFTKENDEQVRFGDVAASVQVDYSLPVKVVSITRNAEAKTASVTWNASPGFEYKIETSVTLKEDSWSTLETYINPPAGTLNWNGSSLPDNAFFRIVRRSTTP